MLRALLLFIVMVFVVTTVLALVGIAVGRTIGPVEVVVVLVVSAALAGLYYLGGRRRIAS